MKTVGQFLKEERKKQKKTLEEIEEKTKIPLLYLKAIEQDDFEALPPKTFIKGFIRNYALYLNLFPERLLAIFRRDFEKKEKRKILPQFFAKPLDKVSFWGPKFFAFVLVGVVLVIFFIYLFSYLKNLIYTPFIEIDSPKEKKVTSEIIEIIGRTNKDASFYINDQLVNLDEEGNFSYSIRLKEGENKILLRCHNRKGQETKKELTIIRQ